LLLLKETLAVCRLAPDAECPAWATGGRFTSLTRTVDELSVVCSEGTGILASLSRPLAEAGASIFALSTYDTDYVMLKGPDLEKAVLALTAAGHRITRE
jgi:hypothetical protein